MAKYPSDHGKCSTSDPRQKVEVSVGFESLEGFRVFGFGFFEGCARGFRVLCWGCSPLY